MADSPKRLVVVTRPRDQAAPVLDALRQRGYEPLLEPMLDIRALPAVLPVLGGYASLVFTSANGVRAFAALTKDRPRPVYAVGENTAAVLAEAGFRDIRIGTGDAAALAKRITEEIPAGSRILHVSGADIARDFEGLLPTIGVERVPLYEAVATSSLSDSLADALYACTINAVLLYSPRTAFTFGILIVKRGLVEKCSYVNALCLSPAVAAQASMVPWAKILTSSAPNSGALLDLLPPAAG